MTGIRMQLGVGGSPNTQALRPASSQGTPADQDATLLRLAAEVGVKKAEVEQKIAQAQQYMRAGQDKLAREAYEDAKAAFDAFEEKRQGLEARVSSRSGPLRAALNRLSGGSNELQDKLHQLHQAMVMRQTPTENRGTQLRQGMYATRDPVTQQVSYQFRSGPTGNVARAALLDAGAPWNERDANGQLTPCALLARQGAVQLEDGTFTSEMRPFSTTIGVLLAQLERS